MLENRLFSYFSYYQLDGFSAIDFQIRYKYPYMRFSDFEQEMTDEEIIDRGRDYFTVGRVGELRFLDDKTVSAEVDGSRMYRVKILIDGDRILDWSCSCPYDLGDICKHVVAVLFALKERSECNVCQHDIDGGSGSFRQTTIDEVVSTLSRDELADL